MAAKVEIMPARLCDLWAYEKLRAEDAVEIMAAGGYSPIEAIVESWANSKETWTVRFDGEPACVYGVAVHPAGTELAPVGVAWLLTTPVVDRHPVTFFRYSKMITKDLAKRYGILMNYVDARYARSLEWARRLGFQVYPALPFGRAGELFHPILYGG